MNQNAILEAAVLLQGQQALQAAVARKFQQWDSRLQDNDARKAFHASLEKFLAASEILSATMGDMPLKMLLLHVSSYRPAQDKQELDRLMSHVKLFKAHLKQVIEKQHPYRTEEYHEISISYQLIASRFRRHLDAVLIFMDARMYDILQQDWNDIAARWKKELDEKLPLPETTL